MGRIADIAEWPSLVPSTSASAYKPPPLIPEWHQKAEKAARAAEKKAAEKAKKAAEKTARAAEKKNAAREAAKARGYVANPGTYLRGLAQRHHDARLRNVNIDDIAE